jgi:hypothetical protein
MAVGGAAYAAGRHGATRSYEEQSQNQNMADLQAQQDALAQQQAALAQQQQQQAAWAQQQAAYAQQPAAPQPVASAPAPVDRVAQLEKLAQLKEQNVLTDEEFQREKQRILSGG